MLLRPLLVLTATAVLLPGCAGAPCGDLPSLRAERDAARADYAELAAPGTAPPEVTEQADEQVHVLDRRVHELEQGCGGR